MKKLLSIVLALAMIISLVPMTASAEDYTVSSVEELKEAIANHNGEWLWVQCDAFMGLEITEDITIPQNFVLHMTRGPLNVEEGATLTINGSIQGDCFNIFGKVVLNGELHANSLNIGGQLECASQIHLNGSPMIDGYENITFVKNQYGGMGEVVVYRQYDANSGIEMLPQELYRAATETREHVRYYFGIYGEKNETIVLNEDLVIPQKAHFHVSGPVVQIPAGRTLTVEGQFDLGGKLVVEGKLVNNSHIHIDYAYGGLLDLSAGGYDGQGSVYIYFGETPVGLDVAAPGLDPSIFLNVTQGEHWWELNNSNYGGSDAETFSSFAELKEAIANAGGEWIYIQYAGKEPLVIEEDLTIPNNVQVNCYGRAVVIPQGVTLTTNGGMEFGDLTVEGTLINKNGINVSGTLTITGELQNNNMLSMPYAGSSVVPAGVTNGRNGAVYYRHYINSADQLWVCVDIAAATEDSKVRHYVHLENSNDVTLHADMTIPGCMQLELMGPDVTVPAGTTLTVGGQLTVSGGSDLKVAGNLVNNSYLDFIYSGEGRQSHLQMLDGGTYGGSGQIGISCGENKVAPETVLIGLDLSQFAFINEYDWGWKLSNESQGGGSGIPFKNFAELKAAIANAGNEWTDLRYSGTDVLVIEEDLVIPENVMLDCYIAAVQIPAGVTLTINEHLNARQLVVDGTLINNNSVYTEILSGTGSVKNEQIFGLRYQGDSAIPGIVTMGPNSVFSWQLDVESVDALARAMDIARNNMSSNVQYEVYFYTDGMKYQLNGDLDIPRNVNLFLSEYTLVVPQGCTLINNGFVSMQSAVIQVDGELINEGYLNIDYGWGGLLKITETGSYSGQGGIRIYAETSDFNPQDALPGLDISYFPYMNEYGTAWELTFYNGGSGGGDWHEITSFAELEEILAANPNADHLEIHYTGSEPLVIEQDIELKKGVYLFAENGTVRIPKGVNVTANYLSTDTVIVDGTLTNNNNLWVRDLTVNGKLINNSVIIIQPDGSIQGENRIQHNYVASFDKTAQLIFQVVVGSPSELHQAVARAKADTRDNYRYIINLDCGGQTVTLDKNLTLPDNATLATLSGEFRIPAGVKLETRNYIGIQSLVTVEGTLTCNDIIEIYAWAEANFVGKLVVADGGSISASGVNIYANNEKEAQAALVGDVFNALEYVSQGQYWTTTIAHTHTWDNGKVTTEPTCAAEGVKTYTCQCGETKTEAIPAIAHKEATDAAVAPTCTTAGKTEGKHCSVCNTVLVKQEEVPATGHSFGEWVTTKEPTTTAEGTAERTCSACGEKETKTLPILYTVPDVTTSVEKPEFVEDIQSAEDDAYIQAEVTTNTTLPETVFDAIAGTDKTLDLVTEDVTWRFNGNDIVKDAKQIDLSVQVQTIEEDASEAAQKILEAIEENPALVMEFADNGILPGKATIQLKVDEELQAYLGEENLCVYYFNEETGELELIARNVQIINGSYVEFAITHCSYYVLTQKVAGDVMLGDVNGDGKVNPKDAAMVLQHFVDKPVQNFNADAADVNGDGKINPKDAAMILQRFVDKLDENYKPKQ